MKPKIKILIADDHALLRRGLATLLEFDSRMSVVGDVKNGQEAIKAALELKPDVVIMDLAMPVMDGVEATRQIRAALPETKVLILTTYSTSVDVARAIEAGASGALVKDEEDDRLIDSILKIAEGGTAFSQVIATELEDSPHPPELTGHQREILELTSNGLSSDEIAAKFGISSYAVNQCLNAIRQKLGASSRTEAVAIALRRQLLKT